MRFEHKEAGKLRLLLTDHNHEFLVLVAFSADGTANFDWYLDLDQADELLQKMHASYDGSRQILTDSFEGDGQVGPAEMQLLFVRRGDFQLDITGSDTKGDFSTELVFPESEWDLLLEQLEDLVAPPDYDFDWPNETLD